MAVVSQTLRSLLKARQWSQSELARQVGVSRQAVSLWLAGDTAAMSAKHLLALGACLGVPVEDLARDLPGLGDDNVALKATFLWDRLYADLDDFVLAVDRGELPALGRLVQVAGPYASEKIAGADLWKRFDDFRRYIHVGQRDRIEAWVRWRTARTAS